MTARREIRNAMTTDLFVGLEDHGILTILLGVRGNGWAGGFGNYNLGHGNRLAAAVKGLLAVFEQQDVQKLVPLPCRVEMEGGRVVKIGHIIHPRWFMFTELP